MNLSVLERLATLFILPREGSYANLKVLTQLRLSLAFTEKEIKDWTIIDDPIANRTNWEINGEVEIPIGERATDIIVDVLKKLDQEKRLPENAVSLYEKFIPTT